ncbi:MAG: Undecaprenyl-diphosphatase, partial [Candidatus Magasanikbacteria bacterium GW2011_GWA2_37_8]
MEYLVSIILGIVEGITEFLPISSTGHLILVSHLLPVVSSEFWKSFIIIIQLGAILSVVVLYWNKLWQIKVLWGKLLIAFIPTAILGLIFYKLIKTYLLNNTWVVVIALLVGGILIILFEKYYHPKETTTEVWPTYKQSFIIGLFQSVAIIPGVSRSAATILGGLSLGIS